jgi:predicted DNA-binding protein (MmcQ/YjbR family)
VACSPLFLDPFSDFGKYLSEARLERDRLCVVNEWLSCFAAKSMSKRSPRSTAVLKELRAFGLTYPGVEVKSPWPGHADLAVNGKTFAYLSLEGEPFGISLKLPYTGEEARKLRFATPTGYGLGKSGWVTFEPTPSEIPSIRQLKSWLDESYRAQAPKKLAALVKYKF